MTNLITLIFPAQFPQLTDSFTLQQQQHTDPIPDLNLISFSLNPYNSQQYDKTNDTTKPAKQRQYQRRTILKLPHLSPLVSINISINITSILFLLSFFWKTQTQKTLFSSWQTSERRNIWEFNGFWGIISLIQWTNNCSPWRTQIVKNQISSSLNLSNLIWKGDFLFLEYCKPLLISLEFWFFQSFSKKLFCDP